MLTFFVLAVIFICVAMMWNEGMWSNSLSFLNTIISAIVATNYFEPVAKFLDEQMPTYTYFWDFLALWLLFVLCYAIIRSVTDQISKTRVRFKLPVEQVGRVVFALLTAWVFVCFMLFTFHTAPIPRTAFYGQFAKTPTSDNFFLSPDKLWLGFMQSRTDPPFLGGQEFDPESEFVLKYGARRQQFSEISTMRVRR